MGKSAPQIIKNILEKQNIIDQTLLLRAVRKMPFPFTIKGTTHENIPSDTDRAKLKLEK